MDYWTRIRRRAWREQLAEFKSNSPRALAQILTLTLTAFAVSLILSNRWIVSGLIALAALIVAVAAPLAARILALPAVVEAEHAGRANLAEQDLKEEIELLEAVLESFTPLVGDTPLLAGLSYCQHRDWTARGGPLQQEGLGELLHQIRHLGQLERLHLWGRTTSAGHMLPIPPAYWERGRIDPTPAQTAKGGPLQTQRNDTLQPRRFHDLRINRAEFEREWPAG